MAVFDELLVTAEKVVVLDAVNTETLFKVIADVLGQGLPRWRARADAMSRVVRIGRVK